MRRNCAAHCDRGCWPDRKGPSPRRRKPRRWPPMRSGSMPWLPPFRGCQRQLWMPLPGRTGGMPPWALSRLVLSILFLFAVGTAALLAARWLLPDPGPEAGGKALSRAARSLGIHAIWISAFLVGLLLGYALLRPSHPAAPAILVVVLEATITVSITDLVIRFLCAPHHPDRRLLPVGDAGARSIHRTAVVTAALTATTLGLADLLGALGMAHDPLIALVLPISTAPFLYLLYRLWSSRPAMAHALSGHLGLGAREAPTLVLGLALVTLYLVGLWLDGRRRRPAAGIRDRPAPAAEPVPVGSRAVVRPDAEAPHHPVLPDADVRRTDRQQGGPAPDARGMGRPDGAGRGGDGLHLGLRPRAPMSGWAASSCACCSTWVSSCCSAMSGGSCLPVPSIA